MWVGLAKSMMLEFLATHLCMRGIRVAQFYIISQRRLEVKVFQWWYWAMQHIHFYHGWWHRTLKNRTHYSCTANFQQLYQQGSDDCGERIWTPQRKMALFDEKVQLQHQQYQHCSLSLLRASQFLWGKQRGLWLYRCARGQKWSKGVVISVGQQLKTPREMHCVHILQACSAS